MSLKKIGSVIAISAILMHSNVYANEVINKSYKSDKEVQQELKIEGKEYKLTKTKRGDEIIEIEKIEVQKDNTVVLDNKDIDKIKEEYNELDYQGEEGKGTLLLNDIKIKENKKEKYWETLAYESKEVQGYKNYDELPSELKNYTKDGLNYKLIKADFQPIGYNNDNTPIFKGILNYGAVVPHYEEEVENYEVTLKYKGSVEKEIKKGHEVIGVYEEIKNYTKEVITAIASLFVVIAGFLLRKNIFIYGDGKKVKGYRKSSKNIEVDISNEKDRFNKIEIVIKKRLAKRLNNTYVTIKDSENTVLKTILNSKDEDIKISI